MAKSNRRNKNKKSESVSNFINELGRLNRYGSIKTIGITLPLVFDAVYVLLKYKLYVADALQIVSCRQAKCERFFTADRRVHEAALSEGINSNFMLKS